VWSAWFALKDRRTGTRIRNFDAVMDETVTVIGERVRVILRERESIGQQQQLLAIVRGNWGEWHGLDSQESHAKLNRYEI